MHYSESPMGVGKTNNIIQQSNTVSHKNEGEISKTHIGPQGIPVFHDLNNGLEYAKTVNKQRCKRWTLGKGYTRCTIHEGKQ